MLQAFVMTINTDLVQACCQPQTITGNNIDEETKWYHKNFQRSIK